MHKGIKYAAGFVVSIGLFSYGLAGGSGAQDEGGTKDEAQLVDTVAAVDSLVPLSHEEVTLRIEVTSKELRVAAEEQAKLERDVAIASRVTEELKADTEVLAQATLKNAIDGYRQSALPDQLVATEDLTDSIRAVALGNAAVSADTESFDIYRELRKDLEIEQAQLDAKLGLTEGADLAVQTLETRLNEELLWFGQLEERRLLDRATTAAAQASYRSQYRGRKQGYYLDTCPVDGPHSFIDSWGFARSGGRRHKGVDMLADEWVDLVAPVSGTVQHFTSGIGGRSYRIFADDGNYYYGTHLAGFEKQGKVEAGEVIGYVGDDGNAAGIPHLHFEIHPGGRGNPINPFIDVAAVCSGAQY